MALDDQVASGNGARQRASKRMPTMLHPTRRGRGGRRHTSNVAGRTNVVINGNVGHDGAVHGASATQTMRIRQQGGVTQMHAEESTSMEGKAVQE